MHIHFVEDVEDRNKAAGEVIEALLQEVLTGGRKRVAGVPDTRSGEPGDHGGKVEILTGLRIEKSTAGPGGQLELLGRALADSFGIAITPDLRREDGAMSLIDIVANRLSNQMIGDGERRESGVGQDAPAFLTVVVGRGGLIDIEVVTPTCELQTVEAHLFGKRSEFSEGKIGPLAGEKSYRSGHVDMQQKSEEHDKQKNVPRANRRCFCAERPKRQGIVLYGTQIRFRFRAGSGVTGDTRASPL